MQALSAASHALSRGGSLRQPLLAVAVAGALSFGIMRPASAVLLVDWDPTASNGGLMTGDVSAPSPYTFASGEGSGLAYSFISISGTPYANPPDPGPYTFKQSMAIAITGFTTSPTGLTTNIGTNWQLIVTMSATGAGNWTPGTYTTTSFTGTYDMWLVQGIPGVGPLATSFNDPADPSTYNYGLDNFTSQGFGVTMRNGMPLACSSSTGTKCLLVGTGSLLSDSTETINTTNNTPTETFSLDSLFTPAVYALGPDGLFDETSPFAFDLLISSGPDGTSPVPVCEPPLIYYSGSVSSQGVCTSGGDNINWQINGPQPPVQIPEPESLALFAGALLLAAGLRRQQQKAAAASRA